MKRYFVLLLLCSSLLFYFLFGMAVSANDSTTVKVGIYENPPKIFTDEQGNASGFWPEILEFIASEEGWAIVYVRGTWRESLNRLGNGEIDIMPDVAYTEERGRLYDFSNEAVYVSWSRVYARKGTDIESILDLEGKDIAVLEGSVNVEGPEGIKELIREFDIDCNLIEVDSYTKVFEIVANGEADAGVANRDFANRYMGNFNLVKTAVIFQPISLYFAFPKDSSLTPHLTGRIDHHLKELKEDGDSVYYQSMEKWLGVKPLENPIIPGWLKWVLAGMGGLAVLLGGGSLILRSQVRARTKELTTEITERKQAEERIQDISSVLRALRKVNQLIVHESDRQELIQKSCDLLIEARGYQVAWIMLIDGDGKFVSAAGAGAGAEELSAVVEQMKRGDYPQCVRQVLEQEQDFVIFDDVRNQHKDCILSGYHVGGAGIACRLEHEGNVYGTITVAVPADLAQDEEKQSLFRELAGDIGYALTSIESEEARKRGEEALRDRERYYRSLIYQLHEDIIVINREYVITDMNNSFMVTVGMPCEQVIGSHCYEISHKQDIPCDQVGEQCLLKEVFKDGQARNCQHTHVKADGSRIMVDILLSPLKDRDGNITHVIEAMRDITEHIHAQEELNKFKTVADLGTYGITMLDAGHIITYVNKTCAEMHGYQPEELIGRHCTVLVPHDQVETVDRLLEKAKMTGSFTNEEVTHKRKDGTIFPVLMTGTTVKDDSGKPLYTSVNVIDITERKQAEEQLRASLREKEVLLREVYHRVKNNLQIIISLLNTQSQYVKDKRDLELFRQSQDRVRAMAMVHEKLYQSGDLAKIDFGEYIGSQANELFMLHGIDRARIQLKVDASEIYLDITEAVPLSLLVNELISNSLKHAFPGDRTGEIRISFHRDGEGQRILSVSDNGVGLPETVNWQNPESMGLQLVVGLAKQVDGALELDRSQGSRFVITLPASKEE